MNTRRVMTWVIFWASVALALGALAWVSVEVVALERREAQSRMRAARQDTIRRALWRLDSTMAPILAVEAARPSSDYRTLEHDQRLLRQLDDSDLTPRASISPIQDAYAERYFSISLPESSGFVGSVQQLESTGQVLAMSAGTPEIRGDTVEDLMDGSASISLDEQLKPMDTEDQPSQSVDTEAPGREARSDSEQIIGYADDPQQPSSSQQADAREAQAESQGPESAPAQTAQQQEEELKAQTAYDFSARNRIAQRAVQSNSAQAEIGALYSNEMQDQSAATRSQDTRSGQPVEPESDQDRMVQLGLSAELGSLSPRWIEEGGKSRLVLVRRSVLDGKPVIQGVFLDWETLRADLIDSLSDVLPGADLVPTQSAGPALPYRMATIPVSLSTPPSAGLPGLSWSPAKVGLLVTWIAIIATIIAVGVVLRAAIVLSQRRGRFVSAVTHELRTPLTTFRLYSQMLADGMVSDEQVRTEYLSTLKRESERLTGIVENVLEYARLTRQRAGKDGSAGVQSISPGALVARFRPGLARRLGQSNLDLVVSLDLGMDQDRTVTADPHAVERIMMNLIENACKYAAPGDDESDNEDLDTRVHLDVGVRNGMLEMLVADHGPGIMPDERAKVFGEFQRGRRGLGNARSGLGLGLALSRGLAREMGGDLQLVRRRGHGAEFLLTIPLDQGDETQSRI